VLVFLAPLSRGSRPASVHSMIWNVMGHDPQCCRFVSHNDGASEPSLDLLKVLLVPPLRRQGP